MTGTRPPLVAVATVAPSPVTTGYALRAYHLLRELARDWEVTLVAPPACGNGTDGAAALVDHVVPVPVRGRWAFLPTQFDPAPLRAAAMQVVAERRPAAILLWSGAEFLTFGVSHLPPAVADRIDCMALTAWRDRIHSGGWRARARLFRTALEYARYERRVARATAFTVVVGEDDARVLRRLSGRATVEVVPNGVILPDRAGGPEDGVPTVAFTGVLNYCPNMDAARYFAGLVWPLVRRAVPEARLVIAGRNPDPSVRALQGHPGVEVLGDVADMRGVLDRAWVAVAPMRCGSGVKNKVLEAWAAGKPVVMSRIATNGLRMDGSAARLVADGDREFADAVIRLLVDGDLRRRVGSAGRAVAAASHTWGEAAARMSALLERATRSSASRA